MFLFTLTICIQAHSQTSDWSSLRKYIGAYSCDAKFYENPIVKIELKRILRKDYSAYQDFCRLSGCGEIGFKHGLMYGDVSQLHVGGYSSLFFVDIEKRRMFLFWMPGRVGELKYKIYGDKPIYPSVLNLISQEMNVAWGHVATFKVQGDSISIVSK